MIVQTRPLWRRILHQIHLWAGLTLCVPLVLLGLTGSILVFEDELVALFSPARMEAAGAPRGAAEIMAAGQAFAPEGMAITMYRAGETPRDPASLFASKPGAKPGPGGRTQIWVDPVTLQKIDPPPALTVTRTIFQLHSHLLIRDYGGRSIVGWMGVAMLAFGMTGLIMWWPRRDRLKQALTVKRGARGYRLHRDLHGAIGIWMLLVFMTSSFTGVYLAFPQTVGAGISSILPARDLRKGPELPPSQGEPMSASEATAMARNEAPGARVTFVMMPPNQPYRVGLLRDGEPHGTPTINIYIDPVRRRVLEIRDPRDYTAGESVLAWQHSLHAGEGLGIVWKLLVFAVGFMPLLFAVTGISMWLIKRKARRASQGLRAQAPPPSVAEAA